jgi:hypothetical protein
MAGDANGSATTHLVLVQTAFVFEKYIVTYLNTNLIQQPLSFIQKIIKDNVIQHM